MFPGLDSAQVPSAAALASAKAAGIRIWSGYISTAPYDGQPHFGLWHPWPRSAFDACQALGSTPIAYASGNDDPVALKALAASWGVRLCLDVENGIRGNGPWVQGWLDASGAGLYGNAPIHSGRSAPFHILAAYPGSGDPRGTWWGQTPRPSGPCAWQWAGTHSEFGISVDSTDFDDWFAGLHGSRGNNLQGEEMQVIVYRNPVDGSEWQIDPMFTFKTPISAARATLLDQFAKLLGNPGLTVIDNANTDLDQLPVGPPSPGGDLSPVLNALAAVKLGLDAAAADIATVKLRIEKDLAP